MTQAIDKLMVKAGFEASDVQSVRFRTALYVGNLLLVGTSVIFLALLLG